MRPGDVEDGEMRARLAALRVDPPDGGFSASLHRRLAEAGPPPAPTLWQRLGLPGAGPAPLRPRAASRWPALGLAGALGVLAAVAILRGAPAPAPAVVVAAEVPATRVAVVRLRLSADVAVQAADLRISLPEGLVFWADGAALPQRRLEWSQALAAGDNEFPVAVRGERPGRYRLTLVAHVGAERIEHEVVLEVTEG